jgi:hypothetical protein
MEKINVAELLKDCPKGMELDCILFNEPVIFDGLKKDCPYPIAIFTKNDEYLYFTKEGYLYNNIANSKCLIFPKGKTTWEGFHRTFKDGDILAGENAVCKYIFIYNGHTDVDRIYYYACLTNFGKCDINSSADKRNIRFATEEEKEKLFKSIKDNGYKWNAETKTLEKMVKDKFDITTLKPFDKVLTRANDNDSWVCNLYSHRIKDYYVVLNAELAPQCIPYDGNQHLLGTTDDCDDYYKTW